MEGQWNLVPEQTLLRVETGRKSVTRVSDAGSHPELWIAAAGESGNGNVVGSGMTTKLMLTYPQPTQLYSSFCAHLPFKLSFPLLFSSGQTALANQAIENETTASSFQQQKDAVDLTEAVTSHVCSCSVEVFHTNKFPTRQPLNPSALQTFHPICMRLHQLNFYPEQKKAPVAQNVFRKINFTLVLTETDLLYERFNSTVSLESL